MNLKPGKSLDETPPMLEESDIELN